MGKLQPNYSWQKYEGEPEDQREQFQYQLMNQHIQVANSVNATIDDDSFFVRERQTSFTWLDNRPIYTKTVTGTLTNAPGTNSVPHGITGLRTLVSLSGTAQNATPMTALGFPLPYNDVNITANGIGLFIDTANVVVTAGNSAWLNYTFHVTIEYTK